MSWAKPTNEQLFGVRFHIWKPKAGGWSELNPGKIYICEYREKNIRHKIRLSFTEDLALVEADFVPGGLMHTDENGVGIYQYNCDHKTIQHITLLGI